MLNQKENKTKIILSLIIGMILFTSCVSTTIIESSSKSKVYLNDHYVGNTPYLMTDTKIIGTCTNVRLESDSNQVLYTRICRDERVDVGAVVGGVLVTFPFLWTLGYHPVHSYELQKLDSTHNEPKSTSYSSNKVSELRDYKKLLDDGIITPNEFEKQKHRILNE